MVLSLGIIGLLLLVAGLVGVWQRTWRLMQGALAYMALFVALCLSVESWYKLAGMTRGDGFGLLGVMLVGLVAGGVTIVFLLVAAAVHAFRSGDETSPVIEESGNS